MTPDRREPGLGDRRLNASPWYAFRGGRRKGSRRPGDPPTPADGLARPVALLAGLLMGLCVIDGMATLRLLKRGCDEANPAMRWLLDLGPAAFLVGKVSLTALGVLFLLNFRHHRFFSDALRIGHFLILIAGMYAALNLFQAVLLVIA